MAGFTFDKTKDGSWTTDIIYGCTVVVIADAQYVIFGHFTDPKNHDHCLDMSDENTATGTIINGLNKALNGVNYAPTADAGENAHAWIISNYTGKPKGLSSISSEIEVMANVAVGNITDHRYTGSGYTGTSSDGPRGKVVVTWSRTSFGGGTLATYIETDHVSWNADYDCYGNQVLSSDTAVTSCSLPAKSTSTSPFPPASTDSLLCQVCTQNSPTYTSCSSIASCTPSKPKATIQLGTSAVHVASFTGSALSTSISSALSELCPAPSKTGAYAQCKTDAVKIGKFDFKDGDNLEHGGSLAVQAAASAYNDTNILKGMIDAAALTAMKASMNQSNCRNVSDEKLSNPSIFGRSSDIAPDKRKDPSFYGGNDGVWCNIGHFAGIQYFSPWWRVQAEPGPVAYLDAEFKFEKPQGGAFDCVMAMELLNLAVDFIAPEFAVQENVASTAIEFACSGDFDKILDLDDIAKIGS